MGKRNNSSCIISPSYVKTKVALEKGFRKQLRNSCSQEIVSRKVADASVEQNRERDIRRTL